MSATIDLKKEPMSISVVEDEETGRVGFSDIPELLLPNLVLAFGRRPLQSAIVPSDAERMFFLDLPVSTRARPRYLDLFESGDLERRVQALEAKKKIADKASYFMATINRSDEATLGRTGVIYFVCRKGCHFCQYREFDEFSLTAEGIADRMLALEQAGANNIQWLSPTAYTAILVKALFIAAERGLKIPIVHKGEGEDPLDDLKMLDGLVDMYLPDIKFIHAELAPMIGLASSYPQRMKACIKEMHRQVGPLMRASKDSFLQGGGLLVRHLLMPNMIKEFRDILRFLMSIDPEIPVHVMTGYEPLHAAKTKEGIDRHLTPKEVRVAVKMARHEEVPRVYVR